MGLFPALSRPGTPYPPSQNCPHADVHGNFDADAKLQRATSIREFDAIFGRVQAKGLKHGSGPYSNEDMRVGEFNGGRIVYFRELNGHLLEIRTKTSAEDIAAMRQAH